MLCVSNVHFVCVDMEELCFWCTIKRDNVVEFLDQYATSCLSQEQFQTATDDLNVCADCVSAYHLARSQVPHLHAVRNLKTKVITV